MNFMLFSGTKLYIAYLRTLEIIWDTFAETRYVFSFQMLIPCQ